MKKITFYLVSIISTFAFLMTSCLGDTKSTSSPENSFSFVTSKDNSSYAITYEGYYIANDFINRLDDNKFYYLKYHLESTDSQNSTTGAYNVSSAGFGSLNSSSFPIQESNNSYRYQDLTDFESLAKLEDLKLVTLSVFYYSPYNLFKDKWVFECTVFAYPEDYKENSISGENNLQLNIVLQPSNQIEGKEASQAIFSAYLSRVNNSIPIGANSKKASYTFKCVVDLSDVRYYFKSKNPTATIENQVISYMQFQYYQYNTNSNNYGTSVTKIGSFGESSNAYGMKIY